MVLRQGTSHRASKLRQSQFCPACCTVTCARAPRHGNSRLGKNRTKQGEGVFVSRSLTRTTPRENGLPYDELASGATIYAYVGNDPLSRVDPLGLAPLDQVVKLAQSYLCANGGNIDAAEDQAMQDRIRRNWEAITPEGDLLRDAENYLTAYQVVADSWAGPDLGSIANDGMVPIYQAKTLIQNMAGQQLWSPASLDAMLAGWQGGADAYDTIALGLPSKNSGCGCGH